MPTKERGAGWPVSLPRPVLDAVSYPGIDIAQFCTVLEAFGPLPIDGKIALAHYLIHARGQYVSHRMWVCDPESRLGSCRKRLDEIGLAAAELLQLLHRDEVGPGSWNLHPAITLALPQLFRVSEEHRSNQIWAEQGLTRLVLLLADLAEVGAQASVIFPAQFPETHGGKRRSGPDPASALVEHLIQIYESMRAQYPESGPKPAFDDPLRRFVRAGLAFVVSPSPETIDQDGKRGQLAEVSFLEIGLPRETRVTDDAIRGVFYRIHKSSRKQT